MKVLVVCENGAAEDMTFYLHLRWQDAVVVAAHDGSKGTSLAAAEAPDLVMADFRLPDMSGLELVSKVREFSDVPMIILAEQETGMERARVLETGADDCIIRPFDPVDLLSRVNALLRRAYSAGFRPDNLPVVSGNVTISLSTHEAFVSGKPLQLTPNEYSLLLQLVRSKGEVLSHRTLLERVWGAEYVDDCGTLRRHICCLRHKLGDATDNPRMILSERGIGYKFVGCP